MRYQARVPVVIAASLSAAMALAAGCEFLPLGIAATATPSFSAIPGVSERGGIGLLGPGGLGGGLGGVPSAAQEIPEPPLALSDRIRTLLPSPESTSSGRLNFNPASEFFLWTDSGNDHLWASKIGGDSRILSHIARPEAIDWSADGTRVALSPGGTASARLLGLSSGGQGEEVGGFGGPGPGGLLPDASGVWRLTPIPREGHTAGGPTPSPFAPGNSFNLKIWPVAGDAFELLTIEQPGRGTWSPDARYFCYAEYPGGDRLSGIDVKVFDRRTATSTRISHLDTDRLSEQEDNLVWGPDRQVYFAHGSQDGTRGAIAITRLPIDSRPATLVILPVTLEPGESIKTIRLSPDFTRAAFETTRQSQARIGNSTVTYPESTGIRLADIASGRVDVLAPAGHIVSWVPGDRLVASTGRETRTRYYIIDVSSGSARP